MPNFTTTLIAATVVALSATPAAAREGAFDDITANYDVATGEYCIKTGWGVATSYSNRLTKAGDCHTADGWRKRGIAFDQVTVAQRLSRAPAERLAAR